MGAISLLLLIGAVPTLLIEAMPAVDAAPNLEARGLLPPFNYLHGGVLPGLSKVTTTPHLLRTTMQTSRSYSPYPAEATDTCLSAIHRGADDKTQLFCNAWVCAPMASVASSCLADLPLQYGEHPSKEIYPYYANACGGGAAAESRISSACTALGYPTPAVAVTVAHAPLTATPAVTAAPTHPLAARSVDTCLAALGAQGMNVASFCPSLFAATTQVSPSPPLPAKQKHAGADIDLAPAAFAILPHPS